MKRTLLFIACVLASLTMSAQEELAVEDLQKSGCQAMTRGDEYAEPVPTIVLTKENSILSVQVLNYESNCATAGFNVKNSMSEGINGVPTLTISVTPYMDGVYAAQCVCPFNVSFTVRGLETNTFYLACWWFEGLVELIEREPLVLEYNAEEVVIDGLKYRLLKTTHQAMLLRLDSWDGEILKIPSEVEYEDEKYTVSSINQYFSCPNITKIILPKTITNTGVSSVEGMSNPFARFASLETIEVEEGNPAICSVDGVLFNKDKTTLIGYPRASPRESYIVPDGVATIGQSAFYYIENLKKVVLPDCVETLNQSLFERSKSLEEVILSPNIKELPAYLFAQCAKLKSVVIPESVTTIGESAFWFCDSLESISLPASVVTVGRYAFHNCTSLKSATLSPNLKEIPFFMFDGCSKLSELIIPSGITSIGNCAFKGCESIQLLDLPESINNINGYAFGRLSNLKDLYCHATAIPNTYKDTFNEIDLSQVTLHVPTASIGAYQAVEPWNNFKEIIALEEQVAYRPFVEDGKVWKLGAVHSGNPVQWVEYYYFDGDTIIDGRTCKQMMRQQYVSPDLPDDDYYSQQPSQGYVGAWYEEDMKVYEYDMANKQLKLMYDFSANANDTLLINSHPYVVGPRQTGGMKGFKGAYREVRQWENGENNYLCAPWLEGVGGIYGPPTLNVFNVELGDPMWSLMSCNVGDEVIYLNDAYEDGATPEAARKRFDFSHTIKTKPKAPRKDTGARASSPAPFADEAARVPAEEGQSLYGEYNDQQLGIRLDPLDDAYTVRITGETGKAVYEKNVNAASIVGLNIDISTYAAGRYTVTVENSQESFTGDFETQTTGISDALRLNDNGEEISDNIYNLQGQRISCLQKGLNIVNGQKVYVK